MREIKFRAWVTDVKKMLSWNEIKDIPMQQLETSNYPHMQYTGLKDKNGKDIYEGDILKVDKHNVHEVGVVTYKGTRFAIGKYGTAIDEWWTMYAVEIIGNIYENPELLSNNTTE